MQGAALFLVLLGAMSGRNSILPSRLPYSVYMILLCDEVSKEEIASGKPRSTVGLSS